MSSSESDLRRGLAVLDQYREQIEGLGQQQEIIRVSLEEHLRARETLTRLKAAGKDSEVLVPLGANAFAVASVRETEKAYVGIGSDLIVYDDVERQLARLEVRINQITEAANAVGQRLAEMQQRAEVQGAAVQNLYDRLQAPAAPGRKK
jgi:prefoldin alpha subunit